MERGLFTYCVTYFHVTLINWIHYLRYAGSGDLRKHLVRSHPGISAKIRPNEPLTEQIVKYVGEFPKKKDDQSGAVNLVVNEHGR